MHLAGRVPLQKTVQGEVRTANSDDAGEPEVARRLADAPLQVLPLLALTGAERGLVDVGRRETARFAVLVQPLQVEAELLVALADQGVEHHSGRGAGVYQGIPG